MLNLGLPRGRAGLLGVFPGAGELGLEVESLAVEIGAGGREHGADVSEHGLVVVPQRGEVAKITVGVATLPVKLFTGEGEPRAEPFVLIARVRQRAGLAAVVAHAPRCRALQSSALPLLSRPGSISRRGG